MQTTRLSSKGQLILPKSLRDAHGWHTGVEFVLLEEGDGVFLKPLNPYAGTKLDQLVGCLGYKGPKKTLKQMEDAIAKGAKRD
jgi:AbrB family looped-hinge helix DNA binding protein